MNTTTPTKRIGYLDAARGIAACMVMFYHYLGWKYPQNMAVKWSHFIFNGSDAVSFFFVLSGFVLAFPYLHHSRSLDVGKFYVNRAYRIYPAFWVALALNAWFSMRKDFHNAPLETFFNTFIANKNGFWEEALLIRGRSRYLGLDWTLTIEIVMSFMIPYLIAMTFYNKRLLLWFSVSTFLMGAIIGVFVMPFALGMIACLYFDEIQAPSFKQTKWYRYRVPILFLAFLFFSIRHIDRIFPFGGKAMDILSLLQLDFFTFTAIGSFIFLVFIIHSKSTQRFLEHPVLLFLGKISYGIYLLHWVIVAAIFEYWDPIVARFPSTKIAFITMLAVCVGLTITLATALYYWVELPFINWGKRITSQWKPSLVISKEQKTEAASTEKNP
ncbi:MAG TPA: acyltransferase [Flavipsychrobacter sp.]|nr:acyltransferase [Flavipsychrobacter sp.]